MSRDFRKIDAYVMSHKLVIQVYKITMNFPKSEMFGLISQMRRAAASIPANIAEGATRQSKREYHQFLYVALGSMAELEYFLCLSQELGYLSLESYISVEKNRKLAAGKLFNLLECVKKEM